MGYREDLMDINNPILDLIEDLDEERIQNLIALARFRSYLKENMGKEISISTVAQFARLVNELKI